MIPQIGVKNQGQMGKAEIGPLYSWTRVEVFNVLASISGIFLLATAIAFVVNTWQRVRALGRKG